ncbi:MAG: leucine-rich repeat domain-containing protein [Bacteroidales bacterium]|jgi:Leucine-rich repeat (LRR) protein|nr:leucine-rich repeat domain-containing protein [Bacteroidales bacterium]MDD4702780.1 leucine-rich repeat domain-containing protein [Bacteroidales bacterium]MDX9798558.1 leucine-rich repeat domain-containing protein [Bacteroidales bacterium]
MNRLFLIFFLSITFFCQGQTNGCFKSLESALKNPTEVITLDLEKKKLKVVPKEIFEMRNLERLILKRNKIKDVPKELSALKHLHYLDLASNNIDSLPKELSILNLDTLILWDNRIREFDREFEKMSSKLKYLDLRAIQMNRQEQKKIKEIFPTTNIRLAFPCNCNR